MKAARNYDQSFIRFLLPVEILFIFVSSNFLAVKKHLDC